MEVMPRLRVPSLAIVVAIFVTMSALHQIATAQTLSRTSGRFKLWSKPGIKWSEARSFCTDDGGWLATDVSPESADMITAFQSSGSPYMGASDAASEGTWRWVTGPLGREANGQGRHFWSGAISGACRLDPCRWAANQPDNYWLGGRENFMTIISNRWNDAADAPGWVNAFICEYPSPAIFGGSAATHSAQYYSTPSVSWFEARQLCYVYGGWLAIDAPDGGRAAVETALGSMPDGAIAWLGGADFPTANTFRWLTGQALNENSGQGRIFFVKGTRSCSQPSIGCRWGANEPRTQSGANALVALQKAAGDGNFELLTQARGGRNGFLCAFPPPALVAATGRFRLYKHTLLVPFESARKHCGDDGGWLATDVSIESHSALSSLTSSASAAWLGGTGIGGGDAGAWRWVGGSGPLPPNMGTFNSSNHRCDLQACFWSGGAVSPDWAQASNAIAMQRGGDWVAAAATNTDVATHWVCEYAPSRPPASLAEFNSTYRVLPGGVTWPEARHVCALFGGRLAAGMSTADTRALATLGTRLARNTTAWVSGVRFTESHSAEWLVDRLGGNSVALDTTTAELPLAPVGLVDNHSAHILYLALFRNASGARHASLAAMPISSTATGFVCELEAATQRSIAGPRMTQWTRRDPIAASHASQFCGDNSVRGTREVAWLSWRAPDGVDSLNAWSWLMSATSDTTSSSHNIATWWCFDPLNDDHHQQQEEAVAKAASAPGLRIQMHNTNETGVVWPDAARRCGLLHRNASLLTLNSHNARNASQATLQKWHALSTAAGDNGTFVGRLVLVGGADINGTGDWRWIGTFPAATSADESSTFFTRNGGCSAAGGCPWAAGQPAAPSRPGLPQFLAITTSDGVHVEWVAVEYPRLAEAWLCAVPTATMSKTRQGTPSRSPSPSGLTPTCSKSTTINTASNSAWTATHSNSVPLVTPHPPAPLATPAQTPPPRGPARRVTIEMVGGSEEAATAVRSTIVVSTITTAAIATPVGVTALARMNAALRALDCALFDDVLRPSAVELPVAFPIGNGVAKYFAGAALSTALACALITTFAVLIRRWLVARYPDEALAGLPHRRRLRRLLSSAGFVAIIFHGYFVPNILAAAATVLHHDRDSSAIAASIASAAISIACHLYFAMLVNVWFGATLATSRGSSDSSTSRSGGSSRSSGRSSNGGDPTATISSSSSTLEVTTREVTERGAAAAAVVGVPDEQLFIETWSPLYDGSKNIMQRSVRNYFIVELTAGALLGGLSGIRPDQPLPCTLVAGAIVFVSALHLLYLAVWRPYRTRLDALFVTVGAFNQVALGVAVVLAIRGWEGAETFAVTCMWIATAMFFIQTVVVLYWTWHVRHRRLARAAARAISAASDDEGKGDGLSVELQPPPAAPALSVPLLSLDYGSRLNDQDGDASLPVVRNPLRQSL